MTNPRVPYRMSTHGPALVAPPEGSILVHLVINVENWRFDEAMPRAILTPPHGRDTIPDVPNFSWADYGMRAGLPRILNAIETRRLPASTSFNASVIDAYPSAAEAMLKAQWEFIGHGIFQRTLNQEASEAENIEQALQKIASFTGTRPRGWLSPGLRQTFDTPDLLAELGVDYVCDWVIDDVPNWMRVKKGRLLQMPYNLELNDSVIFAVENHSSDEFLRRLERTLSVFERECETQPRVLALGLHPHLIGVPHRFPYFEQMLDLLIQHPKVCFMRGGEIMDWYAAQIPSPAS